MATANNSIGQGSGIYAATIENGQSDSIEVNVREVGPRGLAVTISDGWTAANIAFVAQSDEINSTFYPLFDEFGSRILITGISGNGNYAVPASIWGAGTWEKIKLVSVSTTDSDTPVAQGADRALFVHQLG